MKTDFSMRGVMTSPLRHGFSSQCGAWLRRDRVAPLRSLRALWQRNPTHPKEPEKVAIFFRDCHLIRLLYFNTTPLRAGTVNLNRSSTEMLDASPKTGLGNFFASYVTWTCWGDSDVFTAMTNVVPSSERE